MRFCTSLIAIAAIFSVSVTVHASASGGLEHMNAANYYGAPIPPWEAGCKPGWYYGKNNAKLGKELAWLVNDVGS